jgi:hypothetical protein
MLASEVAPRYTLRLNPDDMPPFDDDAGVDDGAVSVCDRGQRKLMQLSGLGGGALFVLVPNSELIHSAIRAVLGVGGVECC